MSEVSFDSSFWPQKGFLKCGGFQTIRKHLLQPISTNTQTYRAAFQAPAPPAYKFQWYYMHPRKLRWNPKMRVWRMIFLLTRGDFQVPAVSFLGSTNPCDPWIILKTSHFVWSTGLPGTRFITPLTICTFHLQFPTLPEAPNRFRCPFCILAVQTWITQRKVTEPFQISEHGNGKASVADVFPYPNTQCTYGIYLPLP